MLAALRSRAFSVAVAVALALAGIVFYHLVTARAAYTDYRSRLASAQPIALAPAPIPASWIVSGSPVFRANTFGRSDDRSTSTGIWECIGPGQFVWHYSTDETIYILEGSAEIEYLGKTFTLQAGESTHFAAGTMAKWHVRDRVKKTWTLYEPGKLARLMRRLFG
jgi:uncharacterized protein